MATASTVPGERSYQFSRLDDQIGMRRLETFDRLGKAIGHCRVAISP
jgi:hypothetical protein